MTNLIVITGEVPIRSSEHTENQQCTNITHFEIVSNLSKHIEKNSSSSCFGKRLGSGKKSSEEDIYDGRTYTYPKSTKGQEIRYNRSLPRTHKLQEKQNQQELHGAAFTSFFENSDCKQCSFEPFKFNEIICCPQIVTDVQFAQNRTLDDKMHHDTPNLSNKIVKQNSLTSVDRKVC